MRQLARVTMTMRDLDRLKCIQAVVDGELRSGHAAERLGLTGRQVRRLARRYVQEGPVGLISRHRSRPSHLTRLVGCPSQDLQSPREDPRLICLRHRSSSRRIGPEKS
jgi:hypothetical protein